MKKSKLFLSTLLLGGLFLVGCSNSTPTTTSSSEPSTSIEKKDVEYTLKVYDLDGTELYNKKVTAKEDSSLFLSLNDKTTLVQDSTDLGHEIKSINGSINDSIYQFNIYVDGKKTTETVDSLKIKAGSVIELKNELKVTLDEKDQLLEKAIYKYAKDYLIADVSDDTLESLNQPSEYNGVVSYTKFSNFWTYLCVGLLKDNGYNIDIKEKNTAIYNAIKDYDLTTLSGTDFGKYYYYAKAFDVNLDSFKTKYKNFVDNTLEEEYTPFYYQEYSIPFEIAPAKALNISSEKITGLVNTTYVPDTTYGTDGFNWFTTANLLFGKEKNTETLTTLSQIDYDNITSAALTVATFASANENPRKAAYKKDNKDLIEKILESYDAGLGLIKYAEADTGINYSTNQIYSSLIAYKYQRDTNTAVNILK